MKIDDYEQEVQKILDDSAAEIEHLENLVAVDDTNIDKASEAMTDASDRGDLKGFQTAKKEKQNALDSMEMHSERLEKLQGKPLISKEKYSEMVGSICAEIDSLTAETEKQLAEYSRQMAAAGEQLDNQIKRANDLLKIIQSKLYLNQDRKRTQSGSFMDNPKAYKGEAYRAVEWSKSSAKYIKEEDDHE